VRFDISLAVATLGFLGGVRFHEVKSSADLDYFTKIGLMIFSTEFFMEAMRKGMLWVAQWSLSKGFLTSFTAENRGATVVHAMRSGNVNLVRFFDDLGWFDGGGLSVVLARSPGLMEALPYLSNAALTAITSSSETLRVIIAAALSRSHRRLFAWALSQRHHGFDLDSLLSLIDESVPIGRPWFRKCATSHMSTHSTAK